MRCHGLIPLMFSREPWNAFVKLGSLLPTHVSSNFCLFTLFREYAKMDVGVDFHGRVHKGMAKQLAKLLEPYQPLFIEGLMRIFLCVRFAY